jgi:hypothetical protein
MQDQSAPAAESLGEAARRARAQKTKSDPGAPKVYTDDKLSQLSGHGVSVVGDGNSGGGSSSGESSFSNSGENSGANVGANSGGNGGNDRNAKIKQIEERKAGLQGQLEALEDEGRKAGADSGWFR